MIIYRRSETAVKVLDTIKKVKPNKLYLIADGPKTDGEIVQCQKTRKAVENKIDWNCEIEKIYSDTNLGCAHRVKTGIDAIFTKEDRVIILEDDTLPNISFFKFCEFCLNQYEDDESIYHISGCNFFPKSNSDRSSYYFTSIVNIWGWATWARAWEKYDIEMKSWQSQDKDAFLKHWCTTKQQLKDTRNMFDLHCKNLDPWTWDYQWVYSCWSNNGLSIMPVQNLVQNLGIGPNSTHTKYPIQQKPYPARMEELTFPLTNNSNTRDLEFERNYYNNTKLSILRKIKDFLKNVHRLSHLFLNKY